MHKKTRNLFNNSSVTSLKNETELTKLRLRPLKIKSKNKLFINSSQSNIRHAFSKKIPVSFFQDNEVNIVRNLNIENETDFFANLFPKGNIEIKADETNQINIKLFNLIIITIFELRNENCGSIPCRLRQAFPMEKSNRIPTITEKETYGFYLYEKIRPETEKCFRL